MKLGTNLAPVTYYSPQLIFENIMQQAAPWRSGAPGVWKDDRPLTITPDGGIILKPGQEAHSLVYRGIGGQYPKGLYVAGWEGSGKLQFVFDAKQSGDFSFRVDKPTANGIGVYVVESDPSDPIRNIRIDNGPGTFTPAYLDSIRAYDTLRFMDWGRTNNSKQMHWEDRRGVYGTQASDNGVAIEWMIDLCNATNSSMWYCVPHLADNEYVSEAFSLIAMRLSAPIKVYIELSNEVWNNQFAQTKHALSHGDLSTWYARRSLEIFRMARDILGDRAVCVIGGQAVNAWHAQKRLEYPGMLELVDAVAIAPYFHEDRSRTYTTADEALDGCMNELKKWWWHLAEHRELAENHDLQLLAYEGGQHLVSHDAKLTDLFIAANRHPRMEEVYDAYFDKMAPYFDLFMHYNNLSAYGKSGSWGASESQYDTDTPKLRALGKRLKPASGDGGGELLSLVAEAQDTLERIRRLVAGGA